MVGKSGRDGYDRNAAWQKSGNKLAAKDPTYVGVPRRVVCLEGLVRAARSIGIAFHVK